MSGGGQPEVSVVMGVRNGGSEMVPTLANLLAQRGVELEVVVVDDGSNDETADHLAAVAARDPRVRVERQPALGLTAALSRGCRVAAAPFIARHDVGDRSHPERLRRQKAILERHPDVVLVSCWTACFGPAAEPIYLERKHGADDVALSIFGKGGAAAKAGPTSHGSVMFRSSAYAAVGGYRAAFALGQDWDLWLRLAAVGRFWKIGETLYARTLATSSLSFACHELQVRFGALALESARLKAQGEDDTLVVERASALSRQLESFAAARRARGRALGNYHVGELLRRRSDLACRTYLRRAAFLRPWLLRAWVRLLQSYLGRWPTSSVDGSTPNAWAGAPWTLPS